MYWTLYVFILYFTELKYVKVQLELTVDKNNVGIISYKNENVTF